MESKATYQKRIESQLAKWKTAIDSLKSKVAQAEMDTKAKLNDQLDRLHDKRARAEQLLKELSATSQDAWEEIKSGVEQGWKEITRTAKKTMAKVRESIAHPNREEEIRQIAYHLWLDEGCPHGRHLDHWFKAESIWREQRAAKPPENPRSAGVKRKPTAVVPQVKGRAAKTKIASRSRSINRGIEKT
jgi:ABC-type phosphate transport system auxiliary subunit